MNLFQVVKMIFGMMIKGGVTPIKLLQMAQGGASPDQLIQILGNIFGQDPNLTRAMQMTKGKSPQELQNIARNMCNESGLDFDGLKATASKFGVKF